MKNIALVLLFVLFLASQVWASDAQIYPAFSTTGVETQTVVGTSSAIKIVTGATKYLYVMVYNLSSNPLFICRKNSPACTAATASAVLSSSSAPPFIDYFWKGDLWAITTGGNSSTGTFQGGR